FSGWAPVNAGGAGAEIERRLAARDPARGSECGEISSRATHVDSLVDAPSDGGSIPPASTSRTFGSRYQSEVPPHPEPHRWVATCSGRGAEHRAVVPIPVALEALVGIVRALPAQKLGELGIAGFDLRPGRPAVVGEEVAAAATDRHVDQTAEVDLRPRQPRAGVHDVQVEHHARPRLPRPGEEGLVVALDQPDAAVDQLDAVAAEVFPHLG